MPQPWGGNLFAGGRSAEPFIRALEGHHLSAVGVARQESRTTLVIGSAADFSLAALRTGHSSDPIESETRVVSEELRELLRDFDSVDLILPFGRIPATDFQAAAERAGMARRSRHGLLIHPVFGLWWSLRLIVELNLEQPEHDAMLEALSRSPILQVAQSGQTPARACDHCATVHCIAVCPAMSNLLAERIASARTRGGSLRATSVLGSERNSIDLRACARHVAGGGCSEICLARAACPEAPDRAYPLEVHKHHHGEFRRMCTAYSLDTLKGQ